MVGKGSEPVTRTTLIFLLGFIPALVPLANGQSFTATIMETSITKMNSNVLHGREFVYMKNGNYAVDDVATMPAPHFRRTVKRADGTEVVAYLSASNDPLAVKSTYKPPHPSVSLPTPGSRCLTFPDGSTPPFEGQPVMETEAGIPAMKTVQKVDGVSITVWRAPSLGCIAIRQEVDFGTGTSLKVLALLDRQPPPDSVFNPAAKEMKPSAAYSAYVSWMNRTAPQPVSPTRSANLEKLDALWSQQHP
jgi:hypothetical protein